MKANGDLRNQIQAAQKANDDLRDQLKEALKTNEDLRKENDELNDQLEQSEQLRIQAEQELEAFKQQDTDAQDDLARALSTINQLKLQLNESNRNMEKFMMHQTEEEATQRNIIEDMKRELEARIAKDAVNEQLIAELERLNKRYKEELLKFRGKINLHEVYIPRKNDSVDQALGQFINTRPENQRMQIMFLRESEGVYRFGQRRVYVKVE